jgi:signal transduction histidine kinase
LKNQDSLGNWILEIKYPPLDSVTFYYKGENGVWKEKQDGENWNVVNRDVDSRNIAFRLPVSKGDTTIYYLKIKSSSAFTLPLQIKREDFFLKEGSTEELFFGFCYGIMLIMLFYNFIIYFVTRDKTYIYFTIYVAFSLIFYGLFYGHITHYVLNFRSPGLNYLNFFSICIFSIAFIQFAKSFLNLSAVSPFFNRLLNFLIFPILFSILILLFTSIEFTASILVYSILVPIIVALVAGFVSLKKGNREARIFVLASGFHVFAIIVSLLRAINLLPAYEPLVNILIISNVVLIALLSLAMADKINIYRNQKIQAQAEVILLRQQETTMLEEKVKERTKQLEQANKEISMVNEDLEAFSYSAAHDLRSPLRTIIGFSQLLEKNSAGVLTEDGKSQLNFISNSAVNMDKLIQDLLAFSHLGKKELIREEIDMKNLVEKVIAQLKSGSEKGQIIDIKVEPLENIIGDHVLLEQVLVNLISNSIKFSRKKERTEIEIGSKISENEVVYWVKDNGTGFDMKYAKKMFEAFQRLHTQSEFEGTGLGLSIIKKIITKHGGRVWAAGLKGEGAVFYFSLPRTEC